MARLRHALWMSLCIPATLGAAPAFAGPEPVRNGLAVATFDVDATPPVGAAMAYGPVVRPADLSLRCRGVVILGSGEPIVLCAVDWIGIGNEAHDAFRAALAAAAGTRPVAARSASIARPWSKAVLP